MKAQYARYLLKFNFTARTSRGEMLEKETYFIRLTDETGVAGVGESAIFRGLSAEDSAGYEDILAQFCRDINRGADDIHMPNSSIAFGYESALAMMDGKKSLFVQGKTAIPINGLVWMDTVPKMLEQAYAKRESGFRCIKFKIGKYDFEQELAMVAALRNRFSASELEIRVDANGAYKPDEALRNMERLYPLHIHSVEQPIRPKNYDDMQRVCSLSSVPVALDEELIGVTDSVAKQELLEYLSPGYIVLKPSLCGGFAHASEWIDTARRLGIGWWVTSALESNVGLLALAQWVSTLEVKMCQGLGTGGLYTNNFRCGLTVENGILYNNPDMPLEIDNLQWITPE